MTSSLEYERFANVEARNRQQEYLEIPVMLSALRPPRGGRVLEVGWGRGGTSGARAALREIARVLRPGGLFIHETSVAQHLAHPVRSFGRRLPWSAVPALTPVRRAVMWSMGGRSESNAYERRSRAIARTAAVIIGNGLRRPGL